MSGIEKLRILQEDFPDIYEGIYSLEQSCKKEASVKTNMILDSATNQAVFKEVIDEFGEYLSQNFSDYFHDPSIIELKQSMIASWLADCSMEFTKD